MQFYPQPRVLRLKEYFLYYGEVGNEVSFRDRFLQMCMPYMAYGDALLGGLCLLIDFGCFASTLERDTYFMNGSMSPGSEITISYLKIRFLNQGDIEPFMK